MRKRLKDAECEVEVWRVREEEEEEEDRGRAERRSRLKPTREISRMPRPTASLPHRIAAAEGIASTFYLPPYFFI